MHIKQKHPKKFAAYEKDIMKLHSLDVASDNEDMASDQMDKAKDSWMDRAADEMEWGSSDGQEK
jgi:hypothetical protein